MNIEIEVVYNGILAKLTTDHISKSPFDPEPEAETFIFKNMGEFMDWIKKNFSSPEKGKEFINDILGRNIKEDTKYKQWTWDEQNMIRSQPITYTTSNTAGEITSGIYSSNTSGLYTLSLPKGRNK